MNIYFAKPSRSIDSIERVIKRTHKVTRYYIRSKNIANMKGI